MFEVRASRLRASRGPDAHALEHIRQKKQNVEEIPDILYTEPVCVPERPITPEIPKKSEPKAAPKPRSVSSDWSASKPKSWYAAELAKRDLLISELHLSLKLSEETNLQ